MKSEVELRSCRTLAGHQGAAIRVLPSRCLSSSCHGRDVTVSSGLPEARHDKSDVPQRIESVHIFFEKVLYASDTIKINWFFLHVDGTKRDT